MGSRLNSLDISERTDSVIISEGISRICDQSLSAESEVFDKLKVVCGRAIFIRSKATSRDGVELPPGLDYKNATAQEIDSYLDAVIEKMLVYNTRQISEESKALAANSHHSFKKMKDFNAVKDLALDDLRLAVLNINVMMTEETSVEKDKFLQFLDEKDEWKDKVEELKIKYQVMIDQASSNKTSKINAKTQECIKKNNWKSDVLKEITKSLLVSVQDADYLQDEEMQKILCDCTLK